MRAIQGDFPAYEKLMATVTWIICPATTLIGAIEALVIGVPIVAAPVQSL